jgi:signal transduction histidine kinase
VVERQIDRINGIVEKLLRFGQPRRLSLSEYDVNRLVEDALGLFENQLRKNGIAVEKDLADLPQAQGDAEQIYQVLTNLILNAVQAMPRGGNLSITTKVPWPGALYVEINDAGMGISHDKIDKIFDPFFSTKEGGAGMGLAVAYRIVKEHGGEINVESAPKKGTRFSIWLPIRPERSV